MANWSRDKIAGLDTNQLGKLRANALKMRASEVLAWCNDELAIRSVKAPRSSRSARPDDERNAEGEATAQLSTFAKGLLAKYDLSVETAKHLSRGVKGFRPLELLGKNGVAKVGGLQLNGSLSLERYISYRLCEDRLIFAYVLLKDRPVDEAQWLVVGPEHLLPNAKLICSQLTSLDAIPDAYTDEFGIVTGSFEEASEAFGCSPSAPMAQI